MKILFEIDLDLNGNTANTQLKFVISDPILFVFSLIRIHIFSDVGKMFHSKPSRMILMSSRLLLSPDLVV